MSTVKADNFAPNLMPMIQIQDVGDLQSFVAAAGQTSFTLTEFDNTSQVRVFVEMDEATLTWVNNTTFTISTPVIAEGNKVRAYKVFGELAYKSYSNIADLVSDEAVINAIIFG